MRKDLEDSLLPAQARLGELHKLSAWFSTYPQYPQFHQPSPTYFIHRQKARISGKFHLYTKLSTLSTIFIHLEKVYPRKESPFKFCTQVIKSIPWRFKNGAEWEPFLIQCSILCDAMVTKINLQKCCQFHQHP